MGSEFKWVLAIWGAPVVDKVRFLAETGLEQVERVWPELSDFVNRAASP